MTDNAPHASRNAGKFVPLTSVRVQLMFAAIAALFMTFVGAFGTGEAPFLPRLAYWLIVMLLGAVIGLGVTTGIKSWGHLARKTAQETCLIAMLIALPLTFVVWAANSLFFGMGRPKLLAWAVLFAFVFIVSLIMTALNHLAANRSMASAAEAAVGQAPDRFTQRLPLPLQHSPILALESEDHYLRVHCQGGDALILMRLSDAIGELSRIEGAQTHRGWWVAKAAITRARRADGKAVLTLSNGIEAPVSRSYIKDVAAKGWFA
jgi:DNA-binding LytR/AlgR family response regulator